MPGSQSSATKVRIFLGDLRSSIQGKRRDYTTGSLPRAIVLLAFPMMLEMVMQSVFAVVDVFFVGKLGSDAVSILGVTDALISLVFAMALGLSMGTAAMVARRIGEQRPVAAARTAVQAIYLGSFIAIGLGIGGALMSRRLLSYMGMAESAIEQGLPFTQIMLGFNITVVLLFLINAIFRGAGDAAIAMRSLWLANLINIVLDPVLIFGWWIFPEMGLTGAAVATCVGRAGGVVYQFAHLVGPRGAIDVDRSCLKLDLPLMRRLLRISGVGMLQFLIGTSSWIGIFRIMALFGGAAVAGYTIAIRLIIFALLPSWGVSNAAATLVGQNLGAGKPDRAQKSVWITCLGNMVFLSSIGLVFILYAPQLVRLFSNETAALEVAAQCLKTISLTYPLLAAGMVLIQAFNGAGDTRTPTWINLFCYWLFQIPLAYVLAVSANLGPRGVFLSILLAQSALALVAGVIFQKGRWKETVV